MEGCLKSRKIVPLSGKSFKSQKEIIPLLRANNKIFHKDFNMDFILTCLYTA
jgi:hypothetical protein